MRSFTLILFTLSFTFTPILYAAKCSNIDLRNESLGEVRNQGAVGWCFISSAADLISHRLGKKISLLALSTTFYSTIRVTSSSAERWEEEDFLEVGLTSNVLKHALKRGVCLEKDLPSKDVMLPSLKEGMVYTNSKANSVSEVIDVLNLLKRQPGYGVYLSLPHVPKDLLLEFLQKNSVKRTLEKITNLSCQGRRIKLTGVKASGNIWSVLRGQLLGKKGRISLIDRELEKKNVVSVGHFASILEDLDAKLSKRHFTVVVGRRWNEETKSCEYLLRNSWGTDCSLYDSSLDCEQGNIWLPKKALARASYLVDYLK